MPKRASSSLRLLPYFVLLGLAEDDQAAAAAHELLDRVELRGRRGAGRGQLTVASHFGSDGWAMTSTSAAASVSRVSGRSVLAEDLEVAAGERLGGAA